MKRKKRGFKGVRLIIDSKGFILRRRCGMWRKMYCWKNNKNRCGDWCPLFDEPVRTGDRVIISLCAKDIDLYQENFRDFRYKEDLERRFKDGLGKTRNLSR